jgi:hypothetical protein
VTAQRFYVALTVRLPIARALCRARTPGPPESFNSFSDSPKEEAHNSQRCFFQKQPTFNLQHPMPKYEVTIQATVRKTITVNARNEDKACELAHELFSSESTDEAEKYDRSGHGGSEGDQMNQTTDLTLTVARTIAHQIGQRAFYMMGTQYNQSHDNIHHHPGP